MKSETDRYKIFSRRSLLLAGIQGGLLSALFGRLYYLQILESERYRTLAENNRISLRLLVPPRGLILDRHGSQIAGNIQNYRVLLIPEQTKGPGDLVKKSVTRTLEDLSQLVPIDESEITRIINAALSKKEFVPITILENLTWEEFSRINVNSVNLPGIVPDVGDIRNYPLGGALAHVVGYVAPVSGDDVIDDPLLELPGFRIGRSGIEKEEDLILRGRAGTAQVEVNAHGRVIREIERNEGEQGKDVSLTLDAGLQKFISKRLGDESAAVALLDVRSGDVLALTSTPFFEPDAFTLGMTQDEWDILVTNPRKPLLNKAVAGQYPPGSTFKMIVALAALEDNIAHQGHSVFCNGNIELGNRKFHCWKKGGHGRMSMTDAIEQSCDVYFYDLALRTGIDRISKMAITFGLGSHQPLGLGIERSGLIPTRAWKLARTGEEWQVGETLITGIGQGFVLTTPLQLASMTAMMANGGIRVTPRLIFPNNNIDDNLVSNANIDPLSDPRSLGISEDSINIIRGGMKRVVNSPTGTGFKSRIQKPGLEMAGKTGTSQVRSISPEEREEGLLEQNNRPWEERDHAIFVGYAPIENPRYAVSVIIEHGGSGAFAAAPIAHDILLEAQIKNSALRRT